MKKNKLRNLLIYSIPFWILPYIAFKSLKYLHYKICVFIDNEIFDSNKFIKMRYADIVENPKNMVYYEKVISVVTEYYSLPSGWLEGKRRFESMALARKIIATILSRYTDLKLYEIARVMKYKNDNHSSVVNAMNSLKDLSKSEKYIVADYENILSKLKLR